MLDNIEGGPFGAILIDPPWRFSNRTGKVAPEHARLKRYETLSFGEISNLPIGLIGTMPSHLYLWTPNALLPEAITCMGLWGYRYKTNIVWYKITKDGRPDRRGVGFYLRNVTEMLLLGVKGSLRTRQAGRSTANIVVTRKREHSRKPDQVYDLIESLSPGPYLELFARGERRPGWIQHGDQLQ